MRARSALLSTLLGVVFTGCAPSLAVHTTVPYRVDSDPPGATVLVNGQTVGTTPLTTQLVVSRWWVGYLRSPNGWAYGPEQYIVTIVSPPLNGEQSKAQTRVILPGEEPEGGTLMVQFPHAPLVY